MSDKLLFDLSFLGSPTDPLGPPKEVPVLLRFHDIPYAPFSKSDKLGRASDWFSAETTNQYQPQTKNQKNIRDPFHAYGASAASKFAAEENSEVNDFEIVDSKANNASSTTSQNQQHHRTVLKGKGGVNKRGMQPPQRQQPQRSAPNTNKTPAQQAQQQRANFWNTQNQNQIDDSTKRRKVAVQVKPNFKKITDIEFNKLAKLNLDLGSQGETLQVRANPSQVKFYNRAFDKLSSSSNLNKKTVPLKVFSKEPTKSYVDTTEDKILLDYAANDTGDVLITDKILTTIMASHKSNYPWNVKIVKNLKTGKLFFSESEPKLETIVDENDSDLFTKSFHLDDNNVNAYGKLTNEFLTASENFEKFVSQSSATDKVNTLADGVKVTDAADVETSKLYKYKLFKVPEVTHVEEVSKKTKLTLAKTEEAEAKYINIIVRTEADLVQKAANGGEFETIAVHALNQYRPTQLDWKSKLISQRGAIISTELRKNNNLFSKWIIAALFGDIDYIKLGFLARDSFGLNDKHSVLGIFNYRPQDLANQSNLSIGNGWAIFKSVIDIVNHEAELVSSNGKDTVEFMLLKDPSHAKLSIYRVD